MKPLLTTAISALMLGAAASAWAQSGPPTVSPPGYCNRSTGDIAECLNRAIAERNDAADAAAASYGSSGATYDPSPLGPPPTSTTTTTTYSRTTYPPPYPGGRR
jgi:hypothetical protein